MRILQSPSPEPGRSPLRGQGTRPQHLSGPINVNVHFYRSAGFLKHLIPCCLATSSISSPTKENKRGTSLSLQWIGVGALQPKLQRHGYDTLWKTELRLNWLISAFAQLSLALFERRAYLEPGPLSRVETRQRIPQFYKSKDKPCFRVFRCFRHVEPIKSDSKRVYTQGVSVAYPLLN